MGNVIAVSGTASHDPEFSHRTYNEEFYKFFIICRRWSGTNDILPVIIRESDALKVKAGERIHIVGEIRTMISNRKMKHYIYANEVCIPESDEDENAVYMNGWFCKEPVYRKTPVTRRRITELLIASNRPYGKTDYIPCITWAGEAGYIRHFGVGTHIEVNGRFQSREYKKKLENGEIETRVTYEVSAKRVEISDGSEKDG